MKFNELLESELLNEMATCYLDGKSRIIVNPVDSGNLLYFKYCNTKGYTSETAVARISLLEPDYIYNHNDGHSSLILSSKAKKSLNEKLQSKSKKYPGYTVFQAVIFDLNMEKFDVYPEETKEITEFKSGSPLPLTLEQPDYRNLPSEEDARKRITGRVQIL